MIAGWWMSPAIFIITYACYDGEQMPVITAHSLSFPDHLVMITCSLLSKNNRPNTLVFSRSINLHSKLNKRLSLSTCLERDLWPNIAVYQLYTRMTAQDLSGAWVTLLLDFSLRLDNLVNALRKYWINFAVQDLEAKSRRWLPQIWKSDAFF